MNINEKLYAAGIAVIFIAVVVGGTFIWASMSIWLRNRREQRRWDGYQREKDREDRLEKQRNEWIGIIRDQNARYAKMVEEVAQISAEWAKTQNNYERAKQIMQKVNLEGLEIK